MFTIQQTSHPCITGMKLSAAYVDENGNLGCIEV